MVLSTSTTGKSTLRVPRNILLNDRIKTINGTKEKPTKRKRKAPAEKPSEKTQAEKRIDEIRSEVEKVLDKLGQMEVET